MRLVTADCNRCGDNSEKKKVLCRAEWRVGVESVFGGVGVGRGQSVPRELRK